LIFAPPTACQRALANLTQAVTLYAGETKEADNRQRKLRLSQRYGRFSYVRECEAKSMTWDLKEPECLTQARLITAAPEFVFEQLKFYGENVGNWHGKAELEKQLLIRDDKLINLALAQFATDKAIVIELYNRASDNHTNTDRVAYDKGLRVACLSNRHFDYFNWPDFDLNDLMSKGLNPEAAALLSNPSVPPSVLVTLFKKTECFSQVDEKNWLWMIQTAANNERLNTDESTIDGPDMGLWDIHKAIFHFLEAAPVTSHSVHATRTLLSVRPKRS
jgi:hypothetical protein